MHQSPDKIRQIKYINIILINDILKKRNIENLEDIKKGFDNLNLNFDEEKILMIISESNSMKLLKDYKMGNNIDASRILNEKEKIMQLLNDLGIPYIIFFIDSDLNNKLDDYTEKDSLKLNNNDEKQIRDNLYLINYIKPFY